MGAESRADKPVDINENYFLQKWISVMASFGLGRIACLLSELEARTNPEHSSGKELWGITGSWGRT